MQQRVSTLFDRIVEDIGEAGGQLTTMAACEGSAGNISVFVPSLACPLEPVSKIELPTAVPALAGGWVVITAGGHRLRDVARRPATTLTALHIGAPAGQPRCTLPQASGRPVSSTVTWRSTTTTAPGGASTTMSCCTPNPSGLPQPPPRCGDQQSAHRASVALGA